MSERLGRFAMYESFASLDLEIEHLSRGSHCQSPVKLLFVFRSEDLTPAIDHYQYS